MSLLLLQTGLEFRDTSYLIDSKCTQTFKAGMVFVLSVGFSPLLVNPADPKSKTWAVLLADTVLITDDQQPGAYPSPSPPDMIGLDWI